ncbi:hypothetical protein D3C85_1884020 [compost metagenome]
MLAEQQLFILRTLHNQQIIQDFADLFVHALQRMKTGVGIVTQKQTFSLVHRGPPSFCICHCRFSLSKIAEDVH